MDAGARAAMHRLSDEIRRCPKAIDYGIEWRFPGNAQERGWLKLKYHREDSSSGRFGYEYDPDSGVREPVYLVSDESVHKVAQAGGVPEDFEKYQKDSK